MQGQSRLNNEDFRKIVMQTPRRPADSDSQLAKPAPKPQAQRKAASKPPKEKRDKKLAPGYRDRAQERRLGTEIPEEMDVEIPALDPDSRMSDVERSKYLGGDAEHTHLVKGLDYALLERVKADIARKEREEEEERKRREEVLEFETTKPKAEKVVTDSGIAVDAPRTFKSHVGKALYTTLFLKHREPTVEHFLPGRMSFVYELDLELDQDLPTTVHRSKDSFPASRDLILAKTHPDILERITKLMVYYNQGEKAYRKMKKRERKEKEAEKQRIAEEEERKRKEEEELIKSISLFDDVDDDDYVVTSSSVQLEYQVPSTKDLLGPLSRLVPEESEKSDTQKKANVMMATITAASRQPETSGRGAGRGTGRGVATSGGAMGAGRGVGRGTSVKSTIYVQDGEEDDMFDVEEAALARKRKSMEDEYSECYPVAFDSKAFSSQLKPEDSDDENAPNLKRKRWDFETDMEWQAYEARRENRALAKEKGQTKKVLRQRDSKLTKQMKSVETLYEEKTGSKFATEDEEKRFENLNVNSYEYKLREKRMREGGAEAAQDLLGFPKTPKTGSRELEREEARGGRGDGRRREDQPLSKKAKGLTDEDKWTAETRPERGLAPKLFK